MKRTSFLWFLFGSLALCLFVFRGGLWGDSLLAPLDILSNLFPKYHYLDPQATGVPANQHIIDGVGYDLPMQRTVYESYHQGDIPWWDPYTLGGRPFLADAHISAVDPIRVLLYHLLPFERAYNWTPVTHFIIGGLGMFLLLGHYRFGRWTCVWLAIAYEYAGYNALYFCHPWIHASFAYYPILWWLWDTSLETPDWWRTAVASLLVAAIFLAGNIQSHAYVALFGGIFCLGYGWTDRGQWGKALRVVAPSTLIGACLAAPFLAAEVELFHHNLRVIEHTPRIAWLSGLASLSTIYPWTLGTFRTLDLGKFVHQDGAGFLVYIGSIGAVLALLGGLRPAPPGRAALKRQALALVCLYGIILSCPLRDFFYGRSAGLPVLGLTLLAAMGVEELFTSPVVFRRLGWAVIGLAIGLTIGLNLVAFVVYPRVLPKVREYVATHDRKNVFGEEAQALREFQVTNLPREISVKNPETVAAVAGLLAVGFVMLCANIRKNRIIQPCLLVLNLVPLLLFTARFVPRQPMQLWNRLLAGGPAQRQVADVLGDTPLRLWEIAPAEHQKVFPYSLMHLYRVRSVDGYSALQPWSIYWLSPEEKERYSPQIADYIYESREVGQATGELIKNPTPGLARVQWKTPITRKFQVTQHGLNEIHIDFTPGPAGTLLWTDTHYPGWKATLDGTPLPLQFTPPTFSSLEIAENAQHLVLRYRPTYLLPSLALSVGAMVLVGGALLTGIGGAVAHRRPPAVSEPLESASPRARILMFGYLPPPIYGPAITYQALLRSSFPQRFDVTFINLTVVRDYRELEVFHWRKLGLLMRQVALELRHLAGQRFDFVFYPIALNRNAFLKDTLLLAIARAFGVPVVLYGHGNGLPEFREKSPRWLQRLIDWAIRSAVAATVPGKNLRFNFLGHLREDQVFAVPNGIEVPSPLPTVTKHPGRFTVLYLGNLVREKGVFVILDAIPLVRQRCPEAHFVFAGAWWSDKDRVAAERLVQERNLTSSVEFTGLVTGDRKWEIVAQGDVLVFPTYFRYETLGQVLLEAMGAGLPVIATRRAAIPEVIDDGVNGLFVAEQDANDLAKKIVTLAHDPDLRARMSAANKEKYADTYTIEHYGQRMAAVFDELVARQKRPGREEGPDST